MNNIDVRNFRKEFELSLEDVGAITATKARTVKSWETGERNIPSSAILLIEKYKNEHNVYNSNKTAIDTIGQKFLLIPLLNLDAVGGINNEEVDVPEYIKDYIPFRDARNGDISIQVTNNSMYKSYPPGSFVHLRKIERWSEFLEPGQDYVIILVDGRRLIKKVKNGTDKTHFLLISENEEYDDVEIKKEFVNQIWLVLANYNKRVI